jgi:putative SOS response-associated peptidase YedK
MCGRYLLSIDIEDIIKSFEVTNINPQLKSELSLGEVFPGTNIPVIIKDDNNKLEFFHWGYKLKGLNRELINIRLETIEEKATFKTSFFTKRCLIPATAYFEWQQGVNKIKHKICIKGQSVFNMAGVYNYFKDSYGNLFIGTAILTMPASGEIHKVHDRMPVILDTKQSKLWLSNLTRDDLLLLKERILLASPNDFTLSSVYGETQLSFDL